MKSPKVRLILAAALFVLWIGWLVSLIFRTPKDDETLSHAQFLVSKLNVIAEVKEENGKPSPKVVVEEVSWPAKERQELAGKTIVVSNIGRCQGFEKPGLYILPLVELADHTEYQVAAVPRSPGYEGMLSPRIYPASSQARKQLASIAKP